MAKRSKAVIRLLAIGMLLVVALLFWLPFVVVIWDNVRDGLKWAIEDMAIEAKRLAGALKCVVKALITGLECD